MKLKQFIEKISKIEKISIFDIDNYASFNEELKTSLSFLMGNIANDLAEIKDIIKENPI